MAMKVKAGVGMFKAAKIVAKRAPIKRVVAKKPAAGKAAKKAKPGPVEEKPKKPKKTTVWDRLLNEDEIKQG